MNDTTRSIGGALGVAVMGSIASSIFTSHLRPALARIPSAFAAQAQSSVGAALAVGRHAPAPIGQHLADTARQAFLTGADVAMIVAVVASLLGAIVAARFLPARAAGEAGVELDVPAAELPLVAAAEAA